VFERRKTNRTTLEQVTVECYTYETQTIPTCEGRILNLGVDGMKLEMDEAVEVSMDDEVFLSFVLPDGSRFTKKKARVIWQARGSDTIFGLYFAGQPPDDVTQLQGYLTPRGSSRS